MGKKRHYYENDEIKIGYVPGRCIHAAECVRRAPAVFDPKQRPWVMPDNEQAEDIAKVVERCPTGALFYELKQSEQSESAQTPNTALVKSNGPLYCSGQIQVLAADGEMITDDYRVALCRCGASNNKPFCDGEHRKVDFQDPAQLEELSVAECPDGNVKITCVDNGPLVFSGPLRIKNGRGDYLVKDKGALCRCGQSANKPFCDGSHNRIEFNTEPE